MTHEKNCSSHLGYVCTCPGRHKEDVCAYCRKLKNYCTGDFAGCHERDTHTTSPHTCNPATAFVRVVEVMNEDWKQGDKLSGNYKDFIQTICPCGKVLSSNEIKE